MSVTVKLDTGGPREPAYTREVSSAIAECVRVDPEGHPLAVSALDGAIAAYPDPWEDGLPEGWRWLTELDTVPVLEGAAP